MKVEFTVPALLELEGIAEWIARDNPARAYAFVEALEKACLDIGRRPRAYPYVDRRRARGVRRRVYGNHLISYREGPDAVQILHVIHGARDYAPLSLRITSPAEPQAAAARASADAMTCQTPRHAVTRRALLGACLAAGALQAVPGCRSTPPSSAYHEAAPGDGVPIYVIAAGWHTEIALPVHVIQGPLRAVVPDFPGARYLSFGWGERNYYMARAPTVGDAMSALFPGPAVLLVTPLYQPPRESRASAQVFELGLSTTGLDRLSSHLWAAFDRSGDGTPRRLAAGPAPGSVFYAATGTYSSSYTCNTWTAEALRVGGAPVTPSGVVFADQLTDQLRSLSARAAEVR